MCLKLATYEYILIAEHIYIYECKAIGISLRNYIHLIYIYILNLQKLHFTYFDMFVHIIILHILYNKSFFKTYYNYI